MQQQASQWIALIVALVAGSLLLLRNVRPGKERRSVGQAFIHLLYRYTRFIWAISRAVDIGYLEYRRVLASTPLEIENEMHLGKRIQPVQGSAELPIWSPVEIK